MKECVNDKDKSSDGKTSAHDRRANQAEMAVPSTVSVSTEATGIMGAVTGGKSTASDIRHGLSTMQGAATGSQGEYFIAEDGIRDRSPSRGLGDVYKRQILLGCL